MCFIYSVVVEKWMLSTVEYIRQINAVSKIGLSPLATMLLQRDCGGKILITSAQFAPSSKCGFEYTKISKDLYGIKVHPGP